jgi:hypothetical protein
MTILFVIGSCICLNAAILRIVGMVLLFGNQAFAYGGYDDYGGNPYSDNGGYPPYGVYCSYADYKSNVITYGDCFGY